MRICLVSPGLEERNRRLQPWCYLLQVARALSESGHQVHLLSDGAGDRPGEDHLAGLPVTRLSSVGDWPLCGNPALRKMLEALSPDLVLWHVGPTSFVRLSTPGKLSVPVVGLFTSPVYRPSELLRLGVTRLARGWRLTAVHLLGLLVPGLLLRRALYRGMLHDLVVECETTKSRLVERGVPGERVHVIRPTIDPAWFEAAPLPADRAQARRELGYRSGDVVVAFFGPPTSLRGLPALLRAAAIAREEDPSIKLLALSRQRDGELVHEQQAIEALVEQLGAGPWARIETGFLPRKRLTRTVAACDLVALPFEVVPSDVPLSVLEVMALGLPVITTEVACLPELVPDGAGLRVPPATPRALATAIHALASDEESSLRLGAAARERARTWQASRQDAQSWDKLLKEPT